MPARKTAYEKILPLIQLHPDHGLIKTALSHFSDEALLRALQRRNALPAVTENLGAFGDDEIRKEYYARGMNDWIKRRLKEAIDKKSWEAVNDLLWGLDE